MPRPSPIMTFWRDEDGAILVLWAMALVAFLGLIGLSFDFGRLATTQSEMQSYADSAALAAAAELDGAPDSLERATRAARGLIRDRQTFGTGDKALGGGMTLIFYAHDAGTGGFVRKSANRTDDPARARFAEVLLGDVAVTAPFSDASARLAGRDPAPLGAMARAVAQFALEACDVTPIAMCLPDVNFSAAESIGQTLTLDAKASVTLPGSIRAVNRVAGLIDGTSVCAGLGGAQLETCLIAARKPASSCEGASGLTISADISGSDIGNGLNTRFGSFAGAAAGLAGRAGFGAAPNVLAGQTTVAGLCLPLDLGLSQDNLGLPRDDCFAGGGCQVRGDGRWNAGRAAYVEAHYGGADPFPGARTRYDFYRAEVAAAAANGGIGQVGALAGGLLNGFAPQMCNPHAGNDPERRLMVIAGIDCSNGSLEASAAAAVPVREFFEVFALGPAEDGRISVEVTACLGGGCGKGNLDTDVRDVVRLVE